MAQSQDTRIGSRDELDPHLPDLVCLSHLRWDFVFQRPQHLMTRFARERRVFFIEEPLYDDGPARLDVTLRDGGVRVVVPRLPHGMDQEQTERSQQELLAQLFDEFAITFFVLWYYTPMALAFTRSLHPALVVYDCMDELSLFRGAPLKLVEREAELFRRADMVFAGGASLYEVKRRQHPHAHLFPSSIDRSHFGLARMAPPEPADQLPIPHPRLGFFGVIDERMDIELLADIAAARPDWHIVMIGPIVKIAPDLLPRPANIHYLGSKSYGDLPRYLAGWDVALLPFARNESTRFISPTKTPEYLAGGKPVVSTPIRDVEHPYGENGLVRIAGTAPEFVAAVEQALELNGNQSKWLGQVDAFLAQNSWDLTWNRMRKLMQAALARRAQRAEQEIQVPAGHSPD